MAHILLNWTNAALFEAVAVQSQTIEQKLPAGEWAELVRASITAGVGNGAYTCQDTTVPARAEDDVIVQYRIISKDSEGLPLFTGNEISVTIPKVSSGVTDLTGEYVE